MPNIVPRTARRKLIFLLGFAIYFSLIWYLWETPVLYPLKVFVVLLHEWSHAAAALATGGRIDAITLSPQQGGACMCPGGNAFLTLSAGYLGSLGWGALILGLARLKKPGPEWVSTGIGIFVLALTLLYVRSSFGIVFGVLFGAGLFLAGRRLSLELNRGLLITLGMTSALYAILDIKSDILDRPHLRSDAAMLAELTGVPTVVWGVAWITVAVVFTGWLFWRSWKRA